MRWLAEAVCVGVDPRAFDATTFPEAEDALELCSWCCVKNECLLWVRPGRSFFDGVAGGIVWRNGYRVRPDNTTREDRRKRAALSAVHRDGTLHAG